MSAMRSTAHYGVTALASIWRAMCLGRQQSRSLTVRRVDRPEGRVQVLCPHDWVCRQTGAPAQARWVSG